MNILILIVVTTILIGCHWSDFYPTSRLVDLDYTIKTNIKMKILREYMDTLIEKKGYAVPEKWQYLNKLVNIDSVNNKRIYFKDQPEEMYLISFNGIVILSDVYNPKIIRNDWISKRDSLPIREYIRIQKRIQLLLAKIDSLSRKNHSSYP